jgi:hypothetical protein
MIRQVGYSVVETRLHHSCGIVVNHVILMFPNRVFTEQVSIMHDDDDLETFILLVLSDSNLPTGSFVASAGLESYVKHGFPSPPISSASERIIDFVRDSLASYAKSALPFVSDAHRSVEKFVLDNNRDNKGDGGQT